MRLYKDYLCRGGARLEMRIPINGHRKRIIIKFPRNRALFCSRIIQKINGMDLVDIDPILELDKFRKYKLNLFVTEINAKSISEMSIHCDIIRDCSVKMYIEDIL